MSRIIRRKAVIAALKKLVADSETLRDMSINPDICGCMKWMAFASPFLSTGRTKNELAAKAA